MSFLTPTPSPSSRISRRANSGGIDNLDEGGRRFIPAPVVDGAPGSSSNSSNRKRHQQLSRSSSLSAPSKILILTLAITTTILLWSQRLFDAAAVANTRINPGSLRLAGAPKTTRATRKTTTFQAEADITKRKAQPPTTRHKKYRVVLSILSTKLSIGVPVETLDLV